MRDYKFIVNAGLKDEVMFGPSNYIRIESASVEFRVETDDGRSFTLSQGEAVKIAEFTKLNFSHASGIPQQIKVIAGKDVEKTSSVLSGSITGSVSITQATNVAESLVLTNTATPTLLVAASAARRSVTFFNRGGTTVRIGSSAGLALGLGIDVPPRGIWVEDVAAGAEWYGRVLATGGAVPNCYVGISELS